MFCPSPTLHSTLREEGVVTVFYHCIPVPGTQEYPQNMYTMEVIGDPKSPVIQGEEAKEGRMFMCP